ncbi:hypothetical protein [Aquimarina algiphila]|uniref:hypothetical protein n=1 Tax=Aquimarina algiphila TaxID=2047982 RepID=UPI00232BD108|nr:hypothetical protein [Aquimarina algiphila]
MKETQRIGKSIHKLFRYDNTIREHVRNFEKLIIFIPLVILFLTSLATALFGPWTLFVLGISIVVVSASFKLYTTYYHRYYRIIERTEQLGKEEEVYYMVQSCISNKKPEKIVGKKSIKWRYISSNKLTKKEAELFFDQLTVEKEVDEIVVSEVRKAIWKPEFYIRFMEKHNMSPREINALGLSFFVYLLGLMMISLIINAVWTFYGLGVFIVTTIMGYILLVRTPYLYLRLIKRTEHQGQYKTIYYRAQSFISHKNLEKIKQKKNIKWTDFRYGEFAKKRMSKDWAEKCFDEVTINKKIIDRVL